MTSKTRVFIGQQLHKMKHTAWHLQINEFIQPVCSWQPNKASFLDHVQNSASTDVLFCAAVWPLTINTWNDCTHACTHIYTNTQGPLQLYDVGDVYNRMWASAELWTVAEGQSIQPHKQDLAWLAWGPPYRGWGPEGKCPGNNYSKPLAQ